MFIAYDIKNGVEYAKLCTSKREDGKVKKTYENLGRVLDKEKGIFKNRKCGVFTYSLDKGYGKAPADFVPETQAKRGKTKLILDFGDSFFVEQFFKKSGFEAVIEEIGYGNPDTLKAMLTYYILCSRANCHAADWFEGNYVRVLYPKANLTSQRISDFLASIGDEYSYQEFFKSYLEFLFQKGNEIKDTGVLIDSTGLPNDIHFPLTAISNHNGEISNEVRLIYVTQQDTGMPIYFRYCPGNVIDTSTLIRTMSELKENGINTKFAILDAGYYSDENIGHLYENKVSFITRLRENRKLYKNLIKEPDEQVQLFRERPLIQEYPILWVDALYEDIRINRRVQKMAVLVVCGMNSEGKRDISAIEPMMEESHGTYSQLFESLKAED